MFFVILFFGLHSILLFAYLACVAQKARDGCGTVGQGKTIVLVLAKDSNTSMVLARVVHIDVQRGEGDGVKLPPL